MAGSSAFSHLLVHDTAPPVHKSAQRTRKNIPLYHSLNHIEWLSARPPAKVVSFLCSLPEHVTRRTIFSTGIQAPSYNIREIPLNNTGERFPVEITVLP